MELRTVSNLYLPGGKSPICENVETHIAIDTANKSFAGRFTFPHGSENELFQLTSATSPCLLSINHEIRLEFHIVSRQEFESRIVATFQSEARPADSAD